MAQHACRDFEVETFERSRNHWHVRVRDCHPRSRGKQTGTKPVPRGLQRMTVKDVEPIIVGKIYWLRFPGIVARVIEPPPGLAPPSRKPGEKVQGWEADLVKGSIFGSWHCGQNSPRNFIEHIVADNVLKN
jgi:hypothetical protein